MSRKPKGYYSDWTLERFKEEVEKLGAESRSDLRKKENSLYKFALTQDGWLGAAFGEPLHRDFSGWTIEHFKKEIKKLGTNSRIDLAKKDSGLYQYALSQDGWLDAAFGLSKTEHHRDHSELTIECFKEKVKKLGAISRFDLAKKDGGLYQYARKQGGWLDAAFGNIKGKYDGLSLDNFVRIVKEMEYGSRKVLQKNENGLYKYASKRDGWLDAAFGSIPIKVKYDVLTLENFIRIVEEFEYVSRWDLGKDDSRLYEYARKQGGWLDAAFGTIKGKYDGLSLDNFVRIVDELGCGSRKDLAKKDNGLYQFSRKQNGWLETAFGVGYKHYSDWDLERFKKEVEKLGVTSRTELNEKSSALYSFASSHGWLGAVFGSKGYSGLSLENFTRIVEEQGYNSRVDLQKNESGLYEYANKQTGWLDAVFGDPLRRDCSTWTVERFKKEVEKIGAESRKDLSKKDSSLYRHSQSMPGWLDAAFGPIKCKYADLTLENFLRIIEEFEYVSRKDLGKKDQGLYVYARKQDGWLDAAFGDPLNRDYSTWTIERFKEEIKMLNVSSRVDLSKKDQGLYVYARNQDGWLDAVFGTSKNEHYNDYKGWTVEHFKKAVEEIGAESRKDLQKKANGLYIFGYKQGWLGAVFGSKGYSGLNLENFVRIVEELGYASRSDLQMKELGLYTYARKQEGWLDAVFPKHSGSIDSILESYVNGSED